MASSAAEGMVITTEMMEFVAGSVGGFAGKLFDYPLDTVKVLLQTQPAAATTTTRTQSAAAAASSSPPRSLGAWECITQTVRHRGVSSLYKGISSPLLGSIAENAVLFSAYNFCQRYFYQNQQQQYSNGKTKDLSLWDLSMAGAGAGFAVSFVLTPVELVKCRLQVQNHIGHGATTNASSFRTFRGPLHVIWVTLQEEGLFRGLYRGHTSTMLREIPGNFCYFGVYELVCKTMIPEGGSKKDLTTSSYLLAGSLSGIAYWTAFYPADTVKSLQQTRPGNMSFWQCFRDVYRYEGGIRGLYRGWGITVARGAPSTALVFTAYEYTMKYLAATATV